jgi:hypothetical protein
LSGKVRGGWLGGFLLITACSPSITRVAAPDGGPAWLIDCDNSPPATCEIAAKERCPQGYAVLASEVGRFTVRCRDEVQQPPTASTTSSDPTRTPAGDSSAESAPPQRSPISSNDAREQPALARALENRLVLRLGLGGGTLIIEETGPDNLPGADGWGMAVDAMAGYALTRSIAVGGTIAFQHANLIGLRFGDFHRPYQKAVLSTLTVAGGTIGLFGIGDTELHADLTGGVAMLTVEQSENPVAGSSASPYTRDSRLAPGVGLSGHVAYGFRVSQQLRLDFGARLMAASTTYDAYSQGLISYAFLVDVLHL